MAVTSASQWKKGKKGLPELTVPSGNTVRYKAPGMQAFLAQGFIPNDLLQFVIASLDANSGKKPTKPKAQLEKEEAEATQKFMKDLASDPTKLASLVETLDKVWVECVIEPDTHYPPDDPKERDEELLYVDEVDFDDKMFLFNACVGGTREVERFREGVAQGVDAVSDKSRDVRPTKRTTQRKRASR